MSLHNQKVFLWEPAAASAPPPVSILFLPRRGWKVASSDTSSMVSVRLGTVAVGSADTGGDKMNLSHSWRCAGITIHHQVSHCPSHSLFLRNRSDGKIGSSAYASPSLHREICSVPFLSSRQAHYSGIKIPKSVHERTGTQTAEAEVHLVCCAERSTLHM